MEEKCGPLQTTCEVNGILSKVVQHQINKSISVNIMELIYLVTIFFIIKKLHNYINIDHFIANFEN